MSIETLNDDILLSVFNCYRLDDAGKWNVRIGWRKLSHVCRRWRHLIYESVFYLNMQLICTNGSPVVDMLAHLPPMPLAIDYQYATRIAGAPDCTGISRALQLRDRVRRVVLDMPSSSLDNLLVLMDEPFPILEQLTISSTTVGMSLILPETFLAPNLRQLTLSGITLPGELTLLSTISFVTLTLTNIQATSYFLPKHLASRLRSFSQLEELTVSFSIPLPRPSSERELLDALESPVTLPTLRRFTFKGVTAYLDSLVAQIRAPLLELLIITLFNQIVFALPHLSNFTNATPGLKLPIAKVIFKHDGVSLVTENRTPQMGDRESGFGLRVICKQFDWQIDSAAQICRSLMPILTCVEELTLDFDGKEISTEWQNGAVDGAVWHELLRPFVGVNTLRVCRSLVWELSCALQSDDVGLDPELLPALQVICRLGEDDREKAFAPFIDARRIAGRPVRLLDWPVHAQISQPQGLSHFELAELFVDGFIARTFSSRSEPFICPPMDHYLSSRPPTLLSRVRVEQDRTPPPSRKARSVSGSVRMPPPPKHIRCRIRPSHMGAGSAWR
jgi:hypothetical protein